MTLQDLAVAALLLAAMIYLAARLLRARARVRSRRAACRGCPLYGTGPAGLRQEPQDRSRSQTSGAGEIRS